VQSTVYIVQALTTITLIHQIFTIQKLAEFKCVVLCIFWDEIYGRTDKISSTVCTVCSVTNMCTVQWKCIQSVGITLHHTVRYRPQASNELTGTYLWQSPFCFILSTRLKVNGNITTCSDTAVCICDADEIQSLGQRKWLIQRSWVTSRSTDAVVGTYPKTNKSSQDYSKQICIWKYQDSEHIRKGI